MLPRRAADVSPSIDSPRPRGERSPPRRLRGASAWSASARPWTWAGLLCLCVFALGCQTGRGVIDDRWMGPWYAAWDGATPVEEHPAPTETAPVVPVDAHGSIADPPEPTTSALTPGPDVPPQPDEDGTIYLWTGVAITSAVGSVILWGWGVDAAAERDDAWSQWRDHPAGSPAESATLRRFRDARLEALGYFICGSLATGLAATATGFALHGWLTADEDLEVAPGPGGISVRGRF